MSAWDTWSEKGWELLVYNN